MKYAITGAVNTTYKQPIVLNGEFTDIILSAKELGYDGVELHTNSPIELLSADVQNMLSNTGMLLTSIGTGSSYTQDNLSLSSEDENTRIKAVKRMFEYIDVAEITNSVVIIGLIKGKISEAKSEEVFKQRLTKSLEELNVYASKRNVQLAIEVINRYESDFINTIESGVRYLDSVKLSHVGLHIDTYHMNIEERNNVKSIILAGNRIKHVHLADSDRNYLGSGHIDFSSIFNALKSIDYQGALAVESLPNPERCESAEKSILEINKIRGDEKEWKN